VTEVDPSLFLLQPALNWNAGCPSIALVIRALHCNIGLLTR